MLCGTLKVLAKARDKVLLALGEQRRCEPAAALLCELWMDLTGPLQEASKSLGGQASGAAHAWMELNAALTHLQGEISQLNTLASGARPSGSAAPPRRVIVSEEQLNDWHQLLFPA